MQRDEWRRRTKQLALTIIRLTERLPLGRASAVLTTRLLRAATSVGANYRAACRARSRADLIAKLGIVEEEADETRYWLELPSEAGYLAEDAVAPLLKEIDELLAMTVGSITTARGARR